MNKWAARAELASLRSWAEQSHTNTEPFWAEFANRCAEIMRRHGKPVYDAVSALYGEFEAREADNVR